MVETVAGAPEFADALRGEVAGVGAGGDEIFARTERGSGILASLIGSAEDGKIPGLSTMNKWDRGLPAITIGGSLCPSGTPIFT